MIGRRTRLISGGAKALHRIVLLAFCGVFAACEFVSPPALPDSRPFLSRLKDSPLSEPTEVGETVAFEEPGNLVIYQGHACAESREKDRQKVLRIEQSHAIPSQMDRATVLLSGWRFRYLDGDHNIVGLGTSIFDVRNIEDGQFQWQAAGAINDDEFDKPYRWCYYYTLVAWNSMVYVASADHGDDLAFSEANRPLEWETALTFHPAFIVVKDYQPKAAILPRGFGFLWGLDHNLQQVAYNLDYSERFIADGKSYVLARPNLSGADQAADAFYSWESKTIFKDEARGYDHDTAEVVSVVSGAGVGLIQPPFTIVPVPALSNCIASRDPERETRKVDHVPFDVAIPMLTGWDLYYVCHDQNVEEVGTWIDEFTYESETGQVEVGSGIRPSGILRYTTGSVLRDHDGDDADRFRHRVSILGFNRAPRPVARGLRFDDAVVGLLSTAADVRGRIRNGTDATLTLTGLQFGGPQDSEFSMYELSYRGGSLPASQLAQGRPLRLLPGEEMQIDGRFLPQAEAPAAGAPRAAWLDVQTSDARWPVIRVDVAGHTRSANPAGHFVPDRLNLGLVEVRPSPAQPAAATRNALLTSDGPTPLVISSLRRPDPSSGFSYGVLQPPPASNRVGSGAYTIGPGASMLLQIRFSPSRTGTATGALVADTNAGPLTLSLQGIGCSRQSGCGE